MVAIPKYEDYSLRELYQVLNAIQADRYPEVYAALEKELASRTPASVAELEDCYYALDNRRNPEYAARLVEQIHALGGPTSLRDEEITDENRYRTFWPRFWALIIDGIVAGVPLALLAYLLQKVIRPEPSIKAYIDQGTDLIALAYYIVLHAKFGQTVGKMATGVKVLDKSEQANISWGQAVMRDIVPVVFFVASLAYLIAFGIPADGEELSGVAAFMLYAYAIAAVVWSVAEIVTMLFNRKRRAVHDFIAGTVVVRFAKATGPNG